MFRSMRIRVVRGANQSVCRKLAGRNGIWRNSWSGRMRRRSVLGKFQRPVPLLHGCVLAFQNRDPGSGDGNEMTRQLS